MNQKPSSFILPCRTFLLTKMINKEMVLLTRPNCVSLPSHKINGMWAGFKVHYKIKTKPVFVGIPSLPEV